MTRLLSFVLAVVLFVAVTAFRQATEAIERRAFLAGAATGWNPGTGRWEQYKIDRSDPDWHEAFRLWIQGGRQ
jgi:hypothetical protein